MLVQQKKGEKFEVNYPLSSSEKGLKNSGPNETSTLTSVIWVQLIAQLVEHYTGITEVRVEIPFRPSSEDHTLQTSYQSTVQIHEVHVLKSSVYRSLVIIKLMRRVKGHLVTLIQSGMYLMICISGESDNYFRDFRGTGPCLHTTYTASQLL